MATITTSELVESIERSGSKRNLYRYTLDTGEIFTQRGWIALTDDNTADMNRRGQWLLDSLVSNEIGGILG